MAANSVAMVGPYPVDVLGNGSVLLGRDVVCDGFHQPYAYRVQTHVHDDHMTGFESSKGFQDLYMTIPTYSLLLADFNADLPVRENILPIEVESRVAIQGGWLTLVSSEHMLGSAQVLVETDDGMRIGYSGDFSWPLTNPIQVDALVVDATYGSPDSVRKYSQAEAESRFVEIVLSLVRLGPVNIHAHRGTIQRALQLLSPETSAPLLASTRLCNEVCVYQQFGAAVGPLLDQRSLDGLAALRSGRYIRLYSKGDRKPAEPKGSTVVLSAYMIPPHDPVMEYSPRSFRVALSNHADFPGTLDYVRATGAEYVVTDNTRGKGVELALALRERLGIDARPSSNLHSHEWGF